MNPVAFEIFGVAVRWYGILIASGMLLGIFLVLKRSKKFGFTDNDIIDLALIALPSAIVGARLYYVIFNWSYYSGDIMQMINIRGGGMAIHGGVIAGVISGVIYTKYKKLNTWLLADLVAPSLILGQAIGRWGNFVNQEAHGGPTDLPWGIMVDGVKVHPTFLYESIWNMMVFAFLLWFDKRKKFNGEIICWYGVLYSVGRFFIEGMRTDSLMLGNLRMAQVISIAIIAFCGGIIAIGRKKAGKTA